jgi:hypothetical protein
MIRSACFSDDRKYRYRLERHWHNTKPLAMFIGLNPSTANEAKDDPTIRRCIDFACAWGCGGMIMCNLFAIVSADPHVLRTAGDPVGDNDAVLVETAKRADRNHVIACWGAHGKYINRRDHRVMEILKGLTFRCLGTTQGGWPRHPLYVRRGVKIEDYIVW